MNLLVLSSSFAKPIEIPNKYIGCWDDNDLGYFYVIEKDKIISLWQDESSTLHKPISLIYSNDSIALKTQDERIFYNGAKKKESSITHIQFINKKALRINNIEFIKTKCKH